MRTSMSLLMKNSSSHSGPDESYSSLRLVVLLFIDVVGWWTIVGPHLMKMILLLRYHKHILYLCQYLWRRWCVYGSTSLKLIDNYHAWVRFLGVWYGNDIYILFMVVSTSPLTSRASWLRCALMPCSNHSGILRSLSFLLYIQCSAYSLIHVMLSFCKPFCCLKRLFCLVSDHVASRRLRYYLLRYFFCKSSFISTSS